MASIEDILSKRQPNEITVTVTTRNDLRVEIERLEAELEDARDRDRWENTPDEAPRLAAEILALREEMEAESVEFRFREIPRIEWERLIRANPPRQDDRKAGAEWNADKFPPAVLAACSVDPEMTFEQAKRLWDEWPFGEVRRLWQAVLTLNSGVGQVPLASTATAVMRSIDGKSTTPPLGESPEASS